MSGWQTSFPNYVPFDENKFSIICITRYSQFNNVLEKVRLGQTRVILPILLQEDLIKDFSKHEVNA